MAFSSFPSFHDSTLTSALKCTKLSATIPPDIMFHRSIDPKLAEELDNISVRVLNLTNRLLGFVDEKDKGKRKLMELEDVVDTFESAVVDKVDLLLERTDSCLDEYLGRKKEPAIVINPAAAKKSTTQNGIKNRPNLQNSSQLVKPQTFFKKPVNDDIAWYPRIPHKYNAQVPLGYAEQSLSEESTTIVSHPYRYEITHTPYPSSSFQSRQPIPSLPLEKTPIAYVSTKEGFVSMLDSLRSATEIALDIEHHSVRTYAGFICLIQISTRDGDWVVDCLIPEIRELLDGGELGEILTNPKIVKVLHGADSDIIWLQQDFNLYIVNLFDTFHASKLLDFPKHGLANLLEMYCDFIPDKSLQLADWRIRPLPENMLEYARSDTHFLLYVYDNLINALLDRQQSLGRRPRSPTTDAGSGSRRASPSTLPLIRQALSRSEETALRTYVKEPYDFDNGTGSSGWDTMARKWNKASLTSGPVYGGPVVELEREVYRAIHEWRDRVAREEDESTRYVMPNHFVFQLADRRPTDVNPLLKLFGGVEGGRNIPPIVRRRVVELAGVIKGVVEGPKVAAVAASTLATPIETPATSEPQKRPSMNIDTTVDERPSLAANPPVDLWGASASKASGSQTSSLFGSTLSQVKIQSQFSSGSMSTTRSSLFGSVATLSTAERSKTNFRELAARIHSTLAISPAIPILPSTSPFKDSGEFKTPVIQDDFTGMQVEIPYVPASQRTTKPPQVTEEQDTSGSKKLYKTKEEDTIVFVGQARQKKRKRGLPPSNPANPSGSSSSDTAQAAPLALADEDTSPPSGTKGSKKGKGKLKSLSLQHHQHVDGGVVGEGHQDQDDEQKAFDFASVPNILDDVDEAENAGHQQRTKKKRKTDKQKEKGGGGPKGKTNNGIFVGDFPAPPRAHNEVLGGSRSHTFK